MSKEEQPNVVTQVFGEIKKAQRESLKKKVKVLVEDYLKTKEILEGILSKMEQELKSSGMTSKDIEELLE